MKYQIFNPWLSNNCIFNISETRCYHGDGESRAAIYNSYHHCLGRFFSTLLSSLQYFSLPCHGCLSHFPPTTQQISQEKLFNTDFKIVRIFCQPSYFQNITNYVELIAKRSNVDQVYMNAVIRMKDALLL